MIKEAIGTGASVELALEDACSKLGLSRDDVKTEILDMPVKKTFGLFGGSPARVRVYVEETPVFLAQKYLMDIFDAIGMQCPKLEVEEKENSAVITISGEDISFLIGRRGETLDSLQYLTGLIANRNTEQYYRITINSGNYREKREQTLTALARRMAFSAIKTRRNVSLEPMNPYERRIIHTAVQGVRGASSWSEGDELSRHVIIGPDRNNGEQPRKEGGQQRQGGRSGGGYRKQSGRNGNQPEGGRGQNAVKEEKAPQKEKPEVPLYGKVEVKRDE